MVNISDRIGYFGFGVFIAVNVHGWGFWVMTLYGLVDKCLFASFFQNSTFTLFK